MKPAFNRSNKCLIIKLCKYVMASKGNYITIRPGRLLGLRGQAAHKFEEVLVKFYGCEKRGTVFYKLICPRARLEALCREIYNLFGAWS